MSRLHWYTKGAITAAVIVGLGMFASAQPQRASPRDKVNATVDGAKISVDYSRPYMKGRKIFAADGLVPFTKVWRTGADQATTLVTDAPLTIGSLSVPAGTYTLYTIPNEKEWTLIVNKQTGQWGTVYQADQDLGRVPMKVSRVDAPVEQFTISVDDTPAGGEIHFTWENTRATAAFTVKK
jgi:hypothetical protein